MTTAAVTKLSLTSAELASCPGPKAPPAMLCNSVAFVQAAIGDEAGAILEAFLNSTVDSVKVLRLDGTLSQMNTPGLSAMQLESFESIRDQPWLDMWPDEGREAARRAFNDALNGGTGRFEGYCPTAKGLPRWWDVVITPIAGPDGRPVKLLTVSRDITERVERTRELQAARRAADDANEAKSRFLANMSHEIRSPLAAILGYCELLEPEKGEEQQKVDTIRSNGKYLLNLISDIIDLSRIESGKVSLEKVPFSPAQLADEVLSLLSVKASEGGSTLDVAYEGPIPKAIVGDPLRTRQVLINLVSNALKFTDRGRVEVALNYCEKAERLTFEVRDNGIGMSPDVLKGVFEAFTQADPSTTRRFGGSGLGLAICREVSALLGAKLSVDSEEGVGTTFRFSLPAAASEVTLVDVERERNECVPDALVKHTTRLPLRVLIVDDRPDMRFMTRMLIESVGGSVELAESGVDALERLDRDADFDAVLMDVQMPEMDGITATRQLRSKGYDLPVIAMTANAMSEDRRECMAAGFTDYLTKPVDFSELIASLRSVTAA